MKLAAGAAFEEVFPVDRRVLAYVVAGSVQLGADERTLRPLEAASFAEGEGVIRLNATSDGAQVVLLAGRPLREPIVSHGPFVMNTELQIEQAIERFRAGGMGTLVSEHFT